MTQRDTILQELNELGITLINGSFSNIYRVPGRYFEELPGQIMSRIKAMEIADGNSGDELGALSPLLNTISRQTPYQAPSGYFDGLEKKLMEAVLLNDNQTPQEELESLSPLLNSIKKEMPFDKLRAYNVPEGYFKNLDISTPQSKEETKVIAITSRKWFRYAAAAVVVGFVALGGLLIFGNNNSTDPEDIVKQAVNNVSDADMNKFIESTDTEFTEDTPMLTASAEVKELVKNLSDEEIQDFVTDAQIAEADRTDDILLN